MWSDGTPLIYRNFLGESDSIHMATQLVLPELVDDLQRAIDKFTQERKEAEQMLHNNMEELEHYGNESNCVVISTNILTAGKWMKVNCSQIYEKSWVICESEIQRFPLGNQKNLIRQPRECGVGESDYSYRIVLHLFSRISFPSNMCCYFS